MSAEQQGFRGSMQFTPAPRTNCLENAFEKYYGNSVESGAQCLCTHFPDDVFAISAPTLISALHSEHVVLNFAFMIF